jgi:hypothetical protein
LTPFKSKELLPKTAEILNIPEEECKAVIDFYYDKLRSSLSKLEFPSIDLEGLGKFYLKEDYANKAIKRYERMIAHYIKKNQTTKIKFLIKTLELYIQQIKDCISMVDIERKKRDLIIKYKQWYVNNKQHKDTEDYKRVAEYFKKLLQLYSKFPQDKLNFQPPVIDMQKVQSL